MVAIVVDDKPFEVDDSLYAVFDEIAGPQEGPVEDEQIKRMLAVCEDDADRMQLIRYLMLWRRMTPRDVNVVSCQCDRVVLYDQSSKDVYAAGAKLRGRTSSPGTTLKRVR